MKISFIKPQTLSTSLLTILCDEREVNLLAYDVGLKENTWMIELPTVLATFLYRTPFLLERTTGKLY